MRVESIFALEKTRYPSGVFSDVGENLRILTRDESSYIPPVQPEAIQKKICPIIIPTHRDVYKNRKNIENIMRVSDTTVIFLCSGNATKEAIADIARNYPRLDWLAVDGPYNYSHRSQNFETTYSSIAFSGEKDIAQKRNFGLLLARLMGWEAVFFLDDDLEITKSHLQKVMGLLQTGNASIVGFSARSFPDNSVVVHAGRMANGPIESFLGGGALAVRTNKPILSFFPHIYNEDWLFLLMYCLFSDEDVVWAGTINQRAYNPYRTVKLAHAQEAGDLLGESLSILAMAIRDELREDANFEAITKKLVEVADEVFWEREINTRISYIQETRKTLRHKRRLTPHRKQALKALDEALRRLVGDDGRNGLQAKEFANWVQAWVRDLHRWNSVTLPVGGCQNLTEAILFLGLTNQFIYNHEKQTTATSFEQFLETTKMELPKELAILDIKTVLPRQSKIIQNLRHTYSIEQYLQARGYGIEHIVSSANHLRFDRPTVTLRDHKPDVTVSMIVSPGESIEQICLSFHNLIHHIPSSNALQFIVWVYRNEQHSQEELEVYRNQVTARLVGETTGTTTFVRSSVLTNTNRNIDHIIDNSLGELAFAYWNCKIPIEHPVFVVNSRNELLRYGTFWEFMRGEHKVAKKTVGERLRMLPESTSQPVTITKKDDEVAQAQARLRLAGKYSAPSAKPALATAITKHMRRAQLTWLQTDDLAFNFRFHHTRDEDSLISIKKSICIPISYSKDLPSDRHELARKIIKTVENEGTDMRSCTLVIYGQSNSWKTIESYRRNLIGTIKAQNPPSTIILTSLTFPLAEDASPALFRQQALAVVRYIHWLQDHAQKLDMKWRSFQ